MTVGAQTNAGAGDMNDNRLAVIGANHIAVRKCHHQHDTLTNPHLTTVGFYQRPTQTDVDGFTRCRGATTQLQVGLNLDRFSLFGSSFDRLHAFHPRLQFDLLVCLRRCFTDFLASDDFYHLSAMQQKSRVFI